MVKLTDLLIYWLTDFVDNGIRVVVIVKV
jgi:hypothetical protein